MQALNKHRQGGFTLVEIAIVLVIIGLLLGGVLKGREMITNAKIKRVDNDFSGVAAAMFAYQDRYGVLPGDDPNASTRFSGTWSASDNGDGNGTIAGSWNSTDNAVESRAVWKHLRGAGLIAGPVDSSNESYQQPRHSFGGIIGVQATAWNILRPSLIFGQIPGDMALILEARGDDGLPSTGSIQGHNTERAYVRTTNYSLAFRL